MQALQAAAAKGIQLPNSVLSNDLVALTKQAAPGQSETNLVQELVRHPEERTVEPRAPLSCRHDEWRPAGENFKSIPEKKEQREAIRMKAVEAAAKLLRNRPPDKKVLFAAAEQLL